MESYAMSKFARRIPRPVLIGLVALALGLAVNTAIFTQGYFDFLAPYPDSDRLVALRPEMLGSQEGVMSDDFIEWKQKTTVFQDLGAATERALSIISPEGSINTTASVVTPGFYQMMGDRFSLGYDFIPADALPGKDQVVILTHSMWKHRVQCCYCRSHAIRRWQTLHCSRSARSGTTRCGRAGFCTARPYTRQSKSG